MIVEYLTPPLASVLRAANCAALDQSGRYQAVGAPVPVELGPTAVELAIWALAAVRDGRVARWARLSGSIRQDEATEPVRDGETRCSQPMHFLRWLLHQREVAAAHPSIGAYLAASDPDFLFDELPTPFASKLSGASGDLLELLACCVILEWRDGDGTHLVGAVLAGAGRWSS